MPIAVVISVTMKIWPMVSRLAATSQESRPISQPARMPESRMIQPGCPTRPEAIVPNARGSITPSRGPRKETNAAKSAAPVRFET